MSLLFKHRRIGKTYWAVTEGGPEADEGTIDMPLGRLDPDFGWWMKPDPQGQPAVTKWKVMGRAADRAIAWLALEPVTGRTHQLRVHCAAMGFAIFGDDIYGNEASQRRARQIKFVPRADAPGLQLHAREVVVPISKNKEPVRVVAPVPPHLHERLRLRLERRRCQPRAGRRTVRAQRRVFERQARCAVLRRGIGLRGRVAMACSCAIFAPLPRRDRSRTSGRRHLRRSARALSAVRHLRRPRGRERRHVALIAR